MNIRIYFALLLLIIAGSSCRKEGIEPNSPFVWIAGDRTLMKSADAGTNWQNYFASEYFTVHSDIDVLNPNQVFRNISFCNTLTGALCGDYGFYATTRDSRVWEGYSYGETTYHTTVNLDTSNSYFLSESGIRSLGNQIRYFGSGKRSLGMVLVDKSTGWVVGDESLVVYTVDSGYNWTQQTTAPGNVYNAVNSHILGNSQREVWIVGNQGVIFKTTDNGQNWLFVPSGVTENLTSICFTDDATAFITGHGGTILKTTDNGNSFLKLNTGTIENLNSISFMNTEVGIAVGDYGTYLKTDNTGNTWSLEQWDKTKNLYCVTFVKRFL